MADKINIVLVHGAFADGSHWQTKPSWYQVSTQDRMIPPETQRWMADRIHACQTTELDTSYASFATRPT